MPCLLDTSNIEETVKCFHFYPIAGVTTNPTLIASKERPFHDILTDILKVIGEGTMLHAQVLGSNAETMGAEANQLRDRLAGHYLSRRTIQKCISRQAYWVKFCRSSSKNVQNL